MAASAHTSGGGSKKRKHELGHLHEDMLERVLARLPPASFFRLRAVCRRWRDAAGSPAFLAACSHVPARDPWFLMLSESQEERRPAVAFDAAEGAWARCHAPPGPVPVGAAGGLVLYRAPDTGALTVANPLTGASRALPPPPPATLQAVAMYGSPYRVVLILGKLTDLSMSAFDPSTNTWANPVPLSRKPDPDTSPATTNTPAPRGNNNNEVDDVDADDEDDGTVFFLTKSGAVMSSTTQRTPSQEHSCAVTCHPNGSNPVAYFLSSTGAVVSCDLARRAFSELPRILPVHAEHSIDVVACGGRAFAVVLTEYLDTASLRVWEFVGGAWAQAAAMPPAMSHAFYGAKADVNCVGHGGRIMVCVSSGEAGGQNGCFLCDVGSNRWEELPRCVDAVGDGGVTDFVAAFSFEPRMEVAV